MSLLSSIGWAIGRVAALIMVFFIIGPVYYNTLDAMYDAAVGQAIPDVTSFAAWVYPVFYWALPSVTVFGIILTVAHLYAVVRRRYYSTEEVYA